MKKGIVLILEHMFAVIAMICVGVVALFPGHSIEDFGKSEYEETVAFQDELQNAGYNILEYISSRSTFETDGVYDLDKLIDIQAYSQGADTSGQNESEIAYRLEDLIQWSKMDYMASSEVVVCQRTDSRYDYFSLKEFENLTNQGMSVSEDGSVVDAKNGNIIYTSYWNMLGSVDEKFKTTGGKTLLDIANESEKWNGRLNEMYSYLTYTLSDIASLRDSYFQDSNQWSEGNTNLLYLFADYETGILYSNQKEYQDINQLLSYEESLKKQGSYVILTPKRLEFETNLDTTANQWFWDHVIDSDSYIFMVAVDEEYPIQDDFYTEKEKFDEFSEIIIPVIVVGVVSAFACLIGLIWLTVQAGRDAKGSGIRLNWFDRWKTEIGLAVIAGLWVLGGSLFVVFAEEGFGYRMRDLHLSDCILQMSVFLGLGAAILCLCFFAGYLSLVRRIKAKTLGSNSLLKQWKESGQEFWKYRSEVFKTTMVFCGFVCIHWLAAASQNGFFVILMLISEGAVGYYLIRKSIGKQKVKKGMEQIAAGDIGYQIPLDRLSGDEYHMAVSINHMGEGLQKAVEQSMKDERLKTDLITNVSHDIKTPLTSIINYVEILKRENIPDEKIQGYLNILEEKALRLKHLTEDVVEASKISSGNVVMEYRNLNLVEVVHQTAGELAEKFENRNLHLIIHVPEQPVYIRADGRRIWRVLENIYNNAAKYAMEGTRVYADMLEEQDRVIFSLKNISEQQLNISADELTERFIRGDVSRSTEGSGLGLSIAKNLTELQGGTFELYLDGDLFKVTITFKKVIQEEG